MKPLLKKVLRELINQDGAKMFYIGNEGSFDRMAYDVLKELKEEYPFIDYKVVLAYLERRKKDIKKFSPWETVFPDELTKTPPRFAIAKRNRIILRLADTAVVYVEGPGGAADYLGRYNSDRTSPASGNPAEWYRIARYGPGYLPDGSLA